MSIEEPKRTRLPDVRPSITHKRTACGIEFYTVVSFYEGDDFAKPAEVFVTLGKRGDVVAGLVDGLCITLSLALQYGVPWEKVREKYLGQKFGGEDSTGVHTSILDGIAKAVDHCIETRLSITGFGEEPPPPAQEPPQPPTPTPTPTPPSAPPVQEAAANVAEST